MYETYDLNTKYLGLRNKRSNIQPYILLYGLNHERHSVNPKETRNKLYYTQMYFTEYGIIKHEPSS